MIQLSKLKNSFKVPKAVLNVVIIVATLTAAVYYLYHHRNLLKSLRHVSLSVGLEVFALYLVMFVVLVVIYDATMKLLDVKVKKKENGFINAYSLFMNFFIPGQTGPVFRAYYMKKHYSLSYLNYGLATAIYYLIYGLLSIIFILAGSQPYFIALPIISVIIVLAIAGLRFYVNKKQATRLNLKASKVAYLILVTLCQLIVQTIIYSIEVRSHQSSVHINQIITYTGTANLALFVALTPGAIGVREGFLLLTQRLHHISSSTIVLANVIDRSVYIIFLLFIGLAITILKVKERLELSATTENP